MGILQSVWMKFVCTLYHGEELLLFSIINLMGLIYMASINFAGELVELYTERLAF